MERMLGLSKPDHLALELETTPMQRFGQQALESFGNTMEYAIGAVGAWLDRTTDNIRGMGKRSLGEMFEGVTSPPRDPMLGKAGFGHAMSLGNGQQKTSGAPELVRGFTPEQARQFDMMLSQQGMDLESLERMTNPRCEESAPSSSLKCDEFAIGMCEDTCMDEVRAPSIGHGCATYPQMHRFAS